MFDGFWLAWKTAILAQTVKRIDDVPLLIKTGKKINARASKTRDAVSALMTDHTKQGRKKLGAAMARLDMELKQLDIVIARIRELRSK